VIAAPATPLGRQIMADLPVLLPVTAVFTICCALLTSVGVNPLRPSSYLSNALLYIICWGFIEIYPFLSRLFTERPESPIRFLREYSATRLPSIIRGLPMFVALIVFMPVFSAMKSAIPLFTTFTWDATLTAADRALFGTDAWRVLQPVLGFPIVTAAMALAYHLVDPADLLRRHLFCSLLL
jgi:hypothetical protein